MVRVRTPQAQPSQAAEAAAPDAQLVSESGFHDYILPASVDALRQEAAPTPQPRLMPASFPNNLWGY